MSVTTVKGRISNKHGTEAGWIAAGTAANPFIPLSGELIIYDPDVNFAYCRFKFGDGVTKVHQLPFVGPFVGTAAQYAATVALGAIEPGTLVVIIDDEDSDDPELSGETTAKLGYAKLGSMVLGQE